MILDPRMVPWDSIVPASAVAMIVVLGAFFLWDLYPRIASILVAIAPIAGWTLSISLLQGRIPPFPPLDGTHWAFWFAIAAVPVTVATLWLSGKRWWWMAALFIMLAFDSALWYVIVRPMVIVIELASSPLQEVAMVLAAIGVLLAIDMRRTSFWLSAEFAPWLIGLTAASVCLALTGTASVSFLALALCLAALPAAIIVLLHGRDAAQTTAVQRQTQAITLPLAFALPILMCAGPLYASTDWSTACLVLAAPVAGLVVMRVAALVISRRKVKVITAQPGRMMEIVGILIGLVFSAIPAGIAAFKVIKIAASEKPFY